MAAEKCALMRKSRDPGVQGRVIHSILSHPQEVELKLGRVTQNPRSTLITHVGCRTTLCRCEMGRTGFRCSKASTHPSHMKSCPTEPGHTSTAVSDCSRSTRPPAKSACNLWAKNNCYILYGLWKKWNRRIYKTQDDLQSLKYLLSGPSQKKSLPSTLDYSSVLIYQAGFQGWVCFCS